MQSTQSPFLLKSAKRILCIRTDRLGDMLVSTPIFRALRAALPEAQIDVLASSRGLPALYDNPYINNLFVFDKHKPLSWPSLIGQITSNKYDVCLNLLGDSRTSNVLSFFSRAPLQYAMANHRRFASTTVYAPNSKDNMIHRFLGFISFLGIPTQGEEMDLVVPAEAKEEALRLYPRKFKMQRLCIFIGNRKKPATRWPETQYAALTAKLLEQKNLEIYIMAGPFDIPLLQAFEHINDPRVIHLIATGTPGKTAAFLQTCDVFLSASSGPLHIANATKTPCIAIQRSGNTCWVPLGEQHVILISPLEDARALPFETVYEAVLKKLHQLEGPKQ